jgi:carbon storage regulator
MDESASVPQLMIVRRPGDAIVINDDILVRVLQVRGESVEIEITAPHDVRVYRGEDYAELQRQLREGRVGEEDLGS